MALSHDFRFGLRSLRRDWLVNLIAVASLAVALAGNTTVFSLVHGVLWRPLPYPEPERIAMVGEREANGPQTLTSAPANFFDWRERNRSFGQLAAFQPASVTIGRNARPVSVPGARVTPEFFSILGVQMVAGRAFTGEEGEVGRDDVVIVTDEFLANHMADLRDPVGAEVFAGGRNRTIVGVLPAGFDFFMPNLQVWLPMALDPGRLSRDERTLFALGRMRLGVSTEKARAEMEALWEELVLAHPESNAGFLVETLNFRYEIPNAQARALFALIQGAVFFVLLIACVNIANLLSARGHRRQREIALRRILGAGRAQVLRQLLLESALLAALAGAIGLAAAWAGVRVIGARFAASVAQAYIPEMNASIVAFSLAITVVAAFLFGLIPALQTLGVELAATMKEGGRGAAGGVRRKMLSRGLVVLEIALSLVLLAGAGIMVQGFLSLRDADPGFDDADLLTAFVTLPVEGARERLDLMDEVLGAVEALPGVIDATFTTALPLNALATSSTFAVVGRPIAPGEPRPAAYSTIVAHDYLEAMRMPLVRGRFFAPADRDDGAPVVVINEALVRRHFPDREPLGERLIFRDREWEIVGVVGDTRQSLIGTDIATQSPDPAIFLPLAQVTPAGMFLVARTAGDPLATAAPLRTAIEPLHPRLALGPMQTLDELVDQVWVGIDLITEVLRGFGWLALALAALGTYGVLAYNVAQRGPEIGIRLAVGARQREVVQLIVRQGIWLGALGILIGAPVVFMLVRVLRFALQGMGTVDPGSAFVVAAVLLLTTLFASLLPALRAARMDPASVLRGD